MANTDLSASDVELARRKSQLLGGDAARAQRMANQYAQPVTGGNLPAAGAGLASVTPATPHVGSKFMQDAGEARAAGLYDLGREWLTGKAGGDVNTLPGGPGAATKRLPEVAPGTSGPSVADLTLKALGAQRAAPAPGSTAPAAEPGQAINPQLAGIQVAPGRAPGVPSMDAVPLPDFQPTPELPTNGYADTGLGDGKGGKIVGRRGADGRMSFTNDDATVAGSRGSAPVGGKGGSFSVISGGQEGMERNLRAVQIMQQTRAENAGGGLTVVADGTQGSLAAQQSRALREARHNDDAQRQAGAAPAGQPRGLQQIQAYDPNKTAADRLALQRGQLDVQAGQLQLEQSQRIATLQRQAADPNATPEQRQQAIQSLNDLQGRDKDRYQSMEVTGGVDEGTGKTIVLRKVFDTRTGRYVDQDVTSGAPAAPAQQYQEGATYTDKAGNRARYVNGQWVTL